LENRKPKPLDTKLAGISTENIKPTHRSWLKGSDKRADAEGVSSANAIAGALNARSIATPRGGKWTARSVLNLTARLALRALASPKIIRAVGTIPR
jgi:hypothetical protein